MIRQIMKEQIDKASSTKERLFYVGVMLFSTKGYHAVGIREICREAGIKESSFYNHYKGKAALLDAILENFLKNLNEVVYTSQEIKTLIDSKNLDEFIEYDMQKFAKSYGFPEYHPALLIVYMERFTTEKAHIIFKTNPYKKWHKSMIEVLEGFIANNTIKNCDVQRITMEYYYGLTGIVDEYIQLIAWEEEFMEASNRIQEHMDYYKDLLKK